MSDVNEQETPDEPAASPEPAPGASDAGPNGDGPSLPPKKKKKKKKKVEADTAGVDALRPELDADGRERPRFLLSFPQDPELEVLIAAFEAGNFRKVREDAPRLVERTERPEVKRAAEELLRRIEPDPLVKFILGVAVFLFVAVVTYVYYAHG